MKHWCKNMFLGRAECSGPSRSLVIFCTNWYSIFDKSTPPCVKPCNSPSASCRVQPCDSCLSCLRCGGTSPSRDDGDFAVSHSWTPYIHPAGTASVFSFHMIGVTPHSCYNFSAAHKNLLSKPQSHVFWIFPLFVLIYSISFHFFLCSLSLSLTHTLAHKHWSLALFMLIGPFSPHESIPFRCIWGYGCHWQPAVREWQPLSVLGVSRGAYNTQSGYWWSPLYGLRPTKGDGVWQRRRGELVVWVFDPTNEKNRPVWQLVSFDFIIMDTFRWIWREVRLCHQKKRGKTTTTTTKKRNKTCK